MLRKHKGTRLVRIKRVWRQGTEIRCDRKGRVVTNGLINPHVCIRRAQREGTLAN